MKELDNSQSEQILSTVKGVINKVNNNVTPNDAFIEVVKQGSFAPEIVSRMIEAYNQSRAVKQFDSVGPEKAANFDIADPHVIFNMVYTSKDKPEANVESFLDTTNTRNFMPKAASVVHQYPSNPVDPYKADINMVTRAAMNKSAALARKVEDAEMDVIHHMHKVTEMIKAAAQSLSQINHEPYEDFERRAQRAYGENGTRLVKAVYKFANIHKPVTRYEKQATFILPPRSPYIEVAKAQAAAESLVDAKEKTASLRAEEIAGADRLGKHASLPVAFMLSAYRKYENSPHTPSPEIEDEDYLAELSAIKLKSLLSDLASTDEVIGSYDPKAIVTAANSAVSLAPESMSNRTALQSALRRTLVDHEMSTDEALGLADADAKLQNARLQANEAIGAKNER